MKKGRFLRLFSTLILLMVIIGCSSRNNGKNSFLPSSETVTSNAWGTYDDAVANYGKIKEKMTEDDLKKFGVYDGGTNIIVRNWLGVYNMLPKYAVESRKLDKGILDFIDAGDSRAKAFEVYILSERRHREGSLFLDVLKFRQKTRTTGYKFSGLVLLVDSKVVYVLRPTGGPINKFRKDKNPFGLLHLAPKVVKDAL